MKRPTTLARPVPPACTASPWLLWGVLRASASTRMSRSRVRSQWRFRVDVLQVPFLLTASEKGWCRSAVNGARESIPVAVRARSAVHRSVLGLQSVGVVDDFDDVRLLTCAASRSSTGTASGWSAVAVWTACCSLNSPRAVSWCCAQAAGHVRCKRTRLLSRMRL